MNVNHPVDPDAPGKPYAYPHDPEKSIRSKQVGASTYHANEAQAILDSAAARHSDDPMVAILLAEAQVHATLSVAAAARATVILP